MPFKVDIPFSLSDLEKELETGQYFYDDFVGTLLGEKWSLRGTDGWLSSLANSLLAMTTKAEVDAFVSLDWNSELSYSYREKTKMLVTVKPDANSNVRHWAGLSFNTDNSILFGHDTDTSANWYATCRSGGTPTSVDTGVVLTTNLVNLKIDIISAAKVNFYIDDVLIATITTNIPTNYLQPIFTVQAVTAATKKFSIDKIFIRADKYTP